MGRIGEGRIQGMLPAFRAFFVAAAVSPAVAQDTYVRLKIGDRAPDFKLKDVTTGRVIALNDFTGGNLLRRMPREDL
jgi:hypothetical protein